MTHEETIENFILYTLFDEFVYKELCRLEIKDLVTYVLS